MLRAAARALATLVVFCAALIAGIDLHLDLPVARRTVAARVNGLLETVFAGKLTIERIGGIGLTHVDDVDARIDGPDGKPVIVSTGTTARISIVKLLRSLRRGDIVIDVHDVSVVSADVDLDTDESGTLRIVDAFAPRSPSLPGPPGRGVRLTLSRVHVKHASARGRMAGVPPIDADADDTDVHMTVTPEAIAIDVLRTRIVARRLPGALDAAGAAEVHLALPSSTGRPLGLRIAYAGTVGAIGTKADLALDGAAVDAVVDAPAVDPEQVRSLGLPWTLGVPASVHAEAHGNLPAISVLARVSAGPATVSVAGPFTVAPRLQAALHVDAKGLDASAFMPSAPRSDVAASGDVKFAEQPDGAFDVRALIDVPGGRVGGVATPPIALTGEMTYAAAPRAGVTANVKAAVRAPGAPTTITVHLAPKKGSVVLSFAADVNVPDLASVPWLGGVAQGHALAHGDGTIDLAGDAIDARLSVAAEDLEAAGVRVQAARAEVHATGRATHPRLDGEVASEGVEATWMHCSSVTARARMDADEAPTFRDVDVEARSSGHRVRVRAKLLRVTGDEVRVGDAVIGGFGVPLEATVEISPGRLHVRARSEHIDLERVAKFTEVSLVKGGHVSLDVDAVVGAGVADGHVAVAVSHAAFASFKDASAHVEATLHGRQAAGQVTVNVADIGSIEVQSSSVQVGAAGPLSKSSWRRAWGAVDLKGIVDLPKLAARLPPGTLPFRPMAGQLQIAGRVERDSMSDSTPEVDLGVSTTGLVLTGVNGSTSWRLDGFNPTVHVSVDGQTGKTSLEAQVKDKTGVCVGLEATSSAVPYASVFAGQVTIESVMTMPFDARMAVPPRSLEGLPAAWGLSAVPGEFGVHADWHGAPDSPAIHVSATLERDHADSKDSALPVDLSLLGDYDGAHATAMLQAKNRGKVALDVTASLDARARDVLAGLSGAAIPWTASARAKIDALPLRTFAVLSDRQVRGRISGVFTLDGLHDDARASATATIDGLAVGDVTCRAARLDATFTGRSFDATARVDQDDGYIDARAHAGALWGRALFPVLDTSQPADASLSARQFRAALLLPLVSGLFAELDGRIDADASVAVDPNTHVARPQGTVKLTNGAFELKSLGGEFSDASANITVTPDGLIEVKDAVVHGMSGRIEAAASARMAGFAFVGARATVVVPKTEPVPIVFDGVKVGTMDGHFDIAADEAADHKVLDMKVDVPTLHMQLPISGTHDVQALGDLEGVTTGVYRGASDFVEVPLNATVSAPSGASSVVPIKIAVRLGHDVAVMRGADLNVRLEGQPTITIAEDVTVAGQINLVHGTLDIYGKPFDIEKGTVSFVGPDPSNPQVVLTAGWTAQDGTRVYADFIGPLKTGKVTLRSDPVLASQNDILALIMVGTTGTSGASNPQDAQVSTVAGAAGGAATQPINRALGGVNRALENLGLAGGISTKIDTSQTYPRPEVELQIARDISLQIAWVLGTPPPGSNPDTTLVTLNWSFLRQWSLATTVGDAGTSIVDLIWQHRY